MDSTLTHFPFMYHQQTNGLMPLKGSELVLLLLRADEIIYIEEYIIAGFYLFFFFSRFLLLNTEDIYTGE